MKTQKSREMIFGIVVLAIAAFYTIMTLQIPSKEGLVDGRTVPIILSILLWVLGIAQLIFGLKASTELLENEGIDIKTVIKTAILIILYIGLFEVLGFIITTLAYLFIQFILLTPSDKKVNMVLYAGISIVVSLFVYSTFRYGLDIMLPQGIITFY